MLCNFAWHASFLLMFDRWTKKAASKITDNAVEGAKQSLNERIEKYGDIIQIGLVLGVIILGSRHITGHSRQPTYAGYLPQYNLPDGRVPVIVNNYYREREDYIYERNQRNQRQIQQRQAQKAHAKY